MPMKGATLLECVTCLSKPGKIGKMSPMPTESRAMAVKMTMSPLARMPLPPRLVLGCILQA